MPPFRWEDIDHSLVSLKLTDLAEEMHNLTEADERRIQFENRGNLNGNAVPSLVLKMKQERADGWARAVYQIYCEVWQKQGYPKCAAFLRAVFANGIVPVLRARTNSIIHQFSLFAKRTNFPSEICSAHVMSTRLNMQRLEDRWRRRLEAEAKECEHAEQRKRRLFQEEPADSSATTNPGAFSIPNALLPRTHSSVDKVSDTKPVNQAHREAVLRKVQNPQSHSVLSTPEAALYFEVQPRTIYRWTYDGKLKSGGRRGSITIESILRWQKARARKHRLD